MYACRYPAMIPAKKHIKVLVLHLMHMHAGACGHISLQQSLSSDNHQQGQSTTCTGACCCAAESSRTLDKVAEHDSMQMSADAGAHFAVQQGIEVSTVHSCQLTGSLECSWTSACPVPSRIHRHLAFCKTSRLRPLRGRVFCSPCSPYVWHSSSGPLLTTSWSEKAYTGV